MGKTFAILKSLRCVGAIWPQVGQRVNTRVRIEGAQRKHVTAKTARVARHVGSGRTIGLPNGTKILLVGGVTGMRSAFNSPAAKLETVSERDSFRGHAFVFQGKRGDLVNVLWRSDDRMCLLMKCLERGRFV